MLTIGAHWSPLELEIVDDNKNIIKVLLSIGAQWSPLELEIVDYDDNNLINVLLTIGAHWTPLELKILNEGLVEYIGVGGVGGVCTEIFIH